MLYGKDPNFEKYAKYVNEDLYQKRLTQTLAANEKKCGAIIGRVKTDRDRR
jgi:hypothetical protein